MAYTNPSMLNYSAIPSQQVMPPNTMYYAQNEQEARMFNLPPGVSEMWFKDLSVSNRMYRKYLNYGQMVFETYSIELIPEPQEAKMSPDYVTRDEISSIVADAVRKELKHNRKSNKGGQHE